MRKRSAALLFNLLPGSGVIPTMEKLSELHHITPRTIRSDLEEINRYLQTIKQPPFHIDFHGLVKGGEDLDAGQVRKNLCGISLASYRFSPEERHILLLAIMICHDDYVTMEFMAERLFVSRITVLSDMEFIKDFLERRHGLDISVKSSKGVRLCVDDERKLRNLLTDLFNRIVGRVGEENVFHHILSRELKFTVSLDKVMESLHRHELESDLLFSEESFSEIALYGFIAINRSALGKYLEPGDACAENENLRAILSFLTVSVGVPLPADQLAALARIDDINVLSMSSKKIIDIELYKILSFFLLKVGGRFGWRLQHDPLLLESLHSHIKSMPNTVSIAFDFIWEKEFRGEYWEILEDIEKHSFILEGYLSWKLSEKMKLSIFVHICAALIRNKKYVAPLGILVVCPGSMATGRLVEAQIRNHFNLTVRGVVSVDESREMMNENEGGIDFIVSTVPIDVAPCPVVIVQPVLADDDLARIMQTVTRLGGMGSDMDAVKVRLIKLVDNLLGNLDGERRTAFVRSLDTLVHDYTPSPPFREEQGLREYLDPDKIVITDDPLDWTAAIRMSGEILIKAGNIERGYIDNMIANVRKFGPYIVIGGRIALAHAKPDAHVLSEGLSMLVCKKGILFDGDEKTPVHAMLCLSTVEDGQYAELLHDVVSLGGNDLFIAGLLAAKNRTDVMNVVARHC